ncbi:MAG: ImmA/IrrE family metallo-endopeptidase [Chitinophagaceae bacterium]|nr:ImmA/IrrE family metallo-endopeptidase [Chitinophagaceae bacterium]
MATSTKLVSPLKRGFKTNAEKIAGQYRRELGLKEYDPMPAIQLAKHLSVRIMVPTEIPGMTEDIIDVLINGPGKGNWSAAIYQKNSKKYIIHNPTHSICRQESNLMHELAHAACEHELEGLESALSGCLLPLRKYNEVQEAEAECLGAVLHLPQKALFHYHHILKKTPDEISQSFNASKEMVRFRLGTSGVTKIKFNK